MTHQVFTSMQPDVLIEVDDAEYIDLVRQGLVPGHILPAEQPKPAADKAPAKAVDKKGTE